MRFPLDVMRDMDRRLERHCRLDATDFKARPLSTDVLQFLSTNGTILFTILVGFVRFEIWERFHWADTFSRTTIDAYPRWVRSQALDHRLLVLLLIICPVPACFTCTDSPRSFCLEIRICI